MQTWKWLYTPENLFNWRFVRNVVLKATVLFLVLNVLFALADPLPFLGQLSAYNVFFRGRERLPYGENPSAAYNLSLYQIDAMFASHTLAGADRDKEYRVLLIGDSSVWGILLEPRDTLAGQINASNYHTADGRRVQVYNLGYPTMSLTKDLVLLDYAMRYQPDLIVWLFTLEAFPQQAQLDTAIVQNNPDLTRHLIHKYELDQTIDVSRFVELSAWDQTIIGHRRTLADLLRLQLYGMPWAITGIDQEYRDDYTPRDIDLSSDTSWHGIDEDSFSPDDLAFDVLRAGTLRAEDTPMLLINEPMFISSGENNDIRYNAFYPRWLYDAYRQLLGQQSTQQGWQFLDLWNAIPDAECYTNSAVHLTPICSDRLARIVGPAIMQIANPGTGVSFSPVN